MKDRGREDFTGVIRSLRFKNEDIAPVPIKFDNAHGVYHNPKAREGFQYVASFTTVDEHGTTWLETFVVEKDGTKMVLQGRAESTCLGKDPDRTNVRRQAVAMIEQWLRSY